MLKAEMGPKDYETTDYETTDHGTTGPRGMDGGGRRTAGSGRLAGFQLVNHAPNAVSLAALDDLERGGAVKGGVWGV